MTEISEKRHAEIIKYVDLYIWRLNPSGSEEKVANIFCSVEKANSPTYTAEKIGQRYIDYFNKWTTEHSDQEERFIGKDDKLMDPYSFMIKRMYENEFSIVRKPRDYYLFGNMLKNDLMIAVTAYKEGIKHGRK